MLSNQVENTGAAAKPVSVSMVNSPSTTSKSSATDAFGRLRISSPYTLFDSQFRYTDNGKWSTVITGGASAVSLPNESAMSLSTVANTASSVTRETKVVFPYQPGKS